MILQLNYVTITFYTYKTCPFNFVMNKRIICATFCSKIRRNVVISNINHIKYYLNKVYYFVEDGGRVEIVKEKVGIGKYVVEGTAVYCGKDIHITIGGGEKYHIGAVSVGVPRNEYKDGKKRTATASVICVQGHKEDEFALKAAKKLATALDCTVSVSVGIHVDDATLDEIKLLEKNYFELVDKFAVLLKK